MDLKGTASSRDNPRKENVKRTQNTNDNNNSKQTKQQRWWWKEEWLI